VPIGNLIKTLWKW